MNQLLELQTTVRLNQSMPEKKYFFDLFFKSNHGKYVFFCEKYLPRLKRKLFKFCLFKGSSFHEPRKISWAEVLILSNVIKMKKEFIFLIRYEMDFSRIEKIGSRDVFRVATGHGMKF